MRVMLIQNMVLSKKEKAISLISNAIASYSLYSSKGELPQNQSLIDFVLKSIPNDIKNEISMGLIDEVFEYVSATRMDS